MIEKFQCKNLAGQTILDPTCGSGNLLIAMIIAGADTDKVFGNEYDEVAVELCRKRINRACDILGKPHIQDWQIHQGNALHKFALTYFGADYDQIYFDGKTQEAARNELLSNPAYDAYTQSKTYKTRYRDAHAQEVEQKLRAQSKLFAETVGGFDWFNM